MDQSAGDRRELRPGVHVVYRDAGPTGTQMDAPATDFPAIVTAVHPPDDDDVVRVNLSVFDGGRATGCFGVYGALESGKSPAAATMGDEPSEGTWRWEW